METPTDVGELVERYERNRESYRSTHYNETQLRREFLDSFFDALGWDVENRQGYAEAYKDVVHEDAVKIGGMTKAPDYSFRVGGTRKFFVEAKKPAIHIKDDPEPAFQLRRYAWSAKLPLSILTSFEEFVVYDCRIKPDRADKAGIGRVFYLTYSDYAARWEEITSIFSKDAVLKGSFDRFADASKTKRGTAEVDKVFLKEIESWRELLARNLALRNSDLTQRQLNYLVQGTIDRIIFLRICEDRGIEDYGRLMALQNGTGAYDRLRQLFRQADERYNSGLFHFREEKGRPEPPDTLALEVTIDDKVIREIIKNLYYPNSPYEFSVISADILGQVYEQFLGKVIHLTSGHRAIIEDKPEVKKAGGVYYTPRYIVDYIVKNTVGRLLEGKTPKQAASLRVLDPACGSGSFLIEAYQYLLDWHRDWYVAHEPRKWAQRKSPPLYQGPGADWRLTTTERKRILLNNIYGVDIDTQAVEVTKLSLLLKVLEGESDQSISQQLFLFHERALPDLGSNIKCGNSLIGPDFYDGRQGGLFDETERYRINVFDWNREFPAIMDAGGFDAVIGNPPWGATLSGSEQKYLQATYTVAQSATLDSYLVFMESGLKRLRMGGVLGYITPDTFLRKDDHLPARAFLLRNHQIVELIETGPVFPKVRDTWCLVSIILKTEPTSSNTIHQKQLSRFVVSAEERLELFGRQEWHRDTYVPQNTWLRRPGMILGYLASDKEQSIIEKIEAYPRLGALADYYRVSRGEEGSKFALRNNKNGDFLVVIPADVKRYHATQGVPVLCESLTPSKVERLYTHPKIWIIRIQKMRWRQRLVCAFDERTNSAGMKTLQVVVSVDDKQEHLKYLSGILSSRLINYWCTNYLSDDLNQSFLEKIPIRQTNLSDGSEAARYDRIVSLVEQMLDLHKQLADAKTPHDKTALQRQIDAVDSRIDQLVYELYGLTNEEIAVIESVSPSKV